MKQDKEMGGVGHMSNYEYVNMSYSKDLTRIKIPKFQRSLVWTRGKKNDLILTLHKDFPFGALLVAPSHDNPKELRLLDGQQRLSTINEYAQNKVKFWRSLNKKDYDLTLKKINQILQEHEAKISQANFDEYLSPNYELGDWTDDYENMKSATKKQLREIVKDTRKRIEDYIELDKLQIPVIKFIGDENSLPEVFENLNKGGVPLTKYEILSAAWDGKVMKMPEDDDNADEILNDVKAYYTNVATKGEFEIDNFSEDDITKSREINLAEFGRALGSFVVDKIPALVSISDKTAINELGFGLLGIISDTSNKELVNIGGKQDVILRNMTENLSKIKRIAQNLNNIFGKLLKQNISFNTKSKSIKSQYSTGLSSSFKILSYFAALWSLDDHKMRDTLKTLPAHYVYDSLTSVWTAHGDQRLQDYYPSTASKNYLTGIKQSDLAQAFETWIEENTGMRKTFSKETKALITIHSNLTYFADWQPTGEDFEFEHIIPKAIVINEDAAVSNVYLSSLGNGMFLPKSLNLKKQTKTLYEYFDFEKGGQRDEYEQYVEKADYPEKSQFNHVIDELKQGKFDEVNQAIQRRANQVSKVIVKNLGDK